MSVYNKAEVGRTIAPLVDFLQDTPAWDKRWDILWYVAKCEAAGFCSTDDQRRACAQRWIAGKRKITPPGTKRRKRLAQEQRKLMANLPAELVAAVKTVIAENPKAVEQFKGGVAKALNMLVGGVMKRYKSDPAVVKSLLEKTIVEG